MQNLEQINSGVVLGAADGRERRTKSGRLASQIKRSELERLFHIPADVAAHQMGIGLTKLKSICRNLNIERWPYRRVRRLQFLAQRVEAGSGNAQDYYDIKHLLMELHIPTQSALWDNLGINMSHLLARLQHYEASSKAAGTAEDEGVQHHAAAFGSSSAARTAYGSASQSSDAHDDGTLRNLAASAQRGADGTNRRQDEGWDGSCGHGGRSHPSNSVMGGVPATPSVHAAVPSAPPLPDWLHKNMLLPGGFAKAQRAIKSMAGTTHVSAAGIAQQPDPLRPHAVDAYSMLAPAASAFCGGQEGASQQFAGALSSIGGRPVAPAMAPLLNEGVDGAQSSPLLALIAQLLGLTAPAAAQPQPAPPPPAPPTLHSGHTLQQYTAFIKELLHEMAGGDKGIANEAAAAPTAPVQYFVPALGGPVNKTTSTQFPAQELSCLRLQSLPEDLQRILRPMFIRWMLELMGPDGLHMLNSRLQ